MRFRSLLVVVFALAASSAWAQPGCRTVVLPELQNTPSTTESLIWIPPQSSAGIVYPFTYTVPANGVTTGVETLFYRLDAIPWGTGAAVYVSGAWRAVTRPIYVIPYQVLPTIAPPGVEPWWASRTQAFYTIWPDIRASWSGFDNYSVVLQPPRHGQSGEAWNVGIINGNDFPVPLHLQAFFRECVTP